jgi:transcriptional regulator with XRE-family HTH domain
MHFDLATSIEIAAELGLRLRRERVRQNLSQGELAARAGLSERSVGNLERNGHASLDTLIRAAAALGLSGSLATLFDTAPATLKAMETMSTTRSRVRRTS